MGVIREKMMLPGSLESPGLQRQLPYVVGVLGDFVGAGSDSGEVRQFLEIDRDTFDVVLAKVSPEVLIRVENQLSQDNTEILVQLSFSSIEDFRPDRIASQIPALGNLLETREQLENLIQLTSEPDNQALTADDVRQKLGIEKPERRQELVAEQPIPPSSGSLLDQVVANTDSGAEAISSKRRMEHGSPIEELLERCTEGTHLSSKELAQDFRNVTLQIDETISRQLSAVMHHPEFQRLEASWRGLHYLVFQTDTSSSLRIKVCNYPREQLWSDLRASEEITQTEIFRLVFQREYESGENEPFALLVGDYEFGHTHAEVDVLRKIAEVCSVALCPLVAAASPEVLGLESFNDLLEAPRPDWIDSSADHVKWNSFRDAPDSVYVALTVPRVLGRMPYESDNTSAGFQFSELGPMNWKEELQAKHEDFLWTNSAYALAANVTRSFAETGWCTRVCGVSGGQHTALPIYAQHQAQHEETQLVGPTEVRITPRREKELADLGFIPVIKQDESNVAVFQGTPTFRKPGKFSDVNQTANSRIASRLPCMLALTRVAQHVRIVLEQYRGSIGQRAQLEQSMNEWLGNYVGEGDDYALRDARIGLSIDERHNELVAELEVLPKLWLEELTQTISIVL